MTRHVVFIAVLLTGLASFASKFPIDDIILGEEIVRVEDVFAPKGFDPNDRILIVVTGRKSTAALDDPFGQVEVNGNTIKVTVKSYRRANRIDHEIPGRFVAEIPLPPLQPGVYDIIVNAESGSPRQAKLEIAPTTQQSIDDFLYADVDTITVDAKARTIELSGENPSACVEFDADDIKFISNDVNTYAVLPILRRKNAVCTQALTPFKVTRRLPDDLHADKILIHVRCLDGRAKNKIMSTSN